MRRDRISLCKSRDRLAYNTFFQWEIWRHLIRGATCYIIPDEIICDSQLFCDFIFENKIKEITISPSLMQTIINTVAADRIISKLSALEVIWFTGEAVNKNLKYQLLDRLPSTRLINYYGLSECATIAVDYLRESEDLPSGFCSVGTPFEEDKVILLDENGNQVSPGNEGEIYVNSPCMFQEYLNKPSLTADSFIDINGSRFFRTGDLAVILPSGKLEIRGRCNSMVNLRGYNISLAGIENTLLEHPEIKSCVVILQGKEEAEKRLIAYFVSQEQGKSPEEVGQLKLSLRHHLQECLPPYMIPGVFVAIEEIPLTPIGKLDRSKLPIPDHSRPKLAVPLVKSKMEAMGAEVLVLSADVANQQQMEAVIAQAEDRFGSINGVIHSVMFTREKALSSIAKTTNTQVQNHCLGKVAGTLILSKVFQNKHLDFCILLSSIASVLGATSHVAYSAANLFMDAFVHQQNKTNAIPWLSVNWEETDQGDYQIGATWIQFTITPEEGIQAFERI